MSRMPITTTMTIQQAVEGLLERWPDEDTGVFQCAVEVNGKKVIVTAEFIVDGPFKEWPTNLLPSTGIPGQPRMEELERKTDGKPE